jgi:hypothetical protein
MKSARVPGAVAVLLCLLVACNIDRTRPAVGRASSIIVASHDSLWTAIEDSVLTTLEPRVFTVRDERTFELTYVNPLSRDWRDLRRFRQILAIGTPADSWMVPVLDGRTVPAQLPAVLERQNVWARNQLVTAIVLPTGAAPAAVLGVLPALAQQFDGRFRQYARSRMFVSGADSALQETLARTAGFALLLPQAYQQQQFDSTWVFRNHSELGAELQRAVLVTWRGGIPPQLSVQMAVEWRDSIGERAYDPPQNSQRTRFETRALEAPNGPGFEVQGIWQTTDTSWPAGGLFITRLLPCPEQNRTYLLDAWLYAPGPSRPKYEYLIQFHTILDSFRCGRQALDAARPARS